MCKVNTIVDEILVKHHPMFKGASKTTIKWFKNLNAASGAFARSIGNLVAEAAAETAPNLIYTDAKGMDFADGTDKKVVTMSKSNAVKIKVGECGVVSKTGDLRVTIYNPSEDKLHYLYVPYDFWFPRVNYQNSGLRTLEFTYSKRAGEFTQGYNEWAVDTFEQLIHKLPA